MVPYSNGELAQMEQAGRNAERCVCCGAIIPEGRQVCPICECQIIYPCDPEKNTTCTKQSCFVNGGPCYHTTNPEFKKTIEGEKEKTDD